MVTRILTQPPPQTAPALQQPAGAIRVVLADSRPVLLRGLAELIGAQHPTMAVIGAATTYATAIYLTEKLRPDVVVLSFFHDTLDALQAIASLVQFKPARVLLLKGIHDGLPVGKALSVGAAGVVIAEDPAESIVHAIRNLCGHAPSPGRAWVGGLATAAPRPDSGVEARGADDMARLTARERQLIGALLRNPSAKYLAIGGLLGISEHTVHNHLSSIYQKLHLVNRADLLVYAATQGLGAEAGLPAPSAWVELE